MLTSYYHRNVSPRILVTPGLECLEPLLRRYMDMDVCTRCPNTDSSLKYIQDKYRISLSGVNATQLNRAIAHGAENGMFTLPKGPSGKVKLAVKASKSSKTKEVIACDITHYYVSL